MPGKTQRRPSDTPRVVVVAAEPLFFRYSGLLLGALLFLVLNLLLLVDVLRTLVAHEEPP